MGGFVRLRGATFRNTRQDFRWLMRFAPSTPWSRSVTGLLSEHKRLFKDFTNDPSGHKVP